MLTLKGIKKDYVSGSLTVEALRGVDISFRRSEFVAVLGPSGCGKTTLLNIIGGLDRYSQGDLIIKGRSTKEFKDADWDSYRNHSVGFVFQSYNLIPHQSVLSNVELALTISGVSPAERRRRAVEVLTRVGLSDQLKKRPNEMSGGQMQRVAIARALINDPEILLADEPTGALDSETSVQIMEILKEIASDRLVVMVTHNPDLADAYATRVIRLLDGRVTDDTHPFSEEESLADHAKQLSHTKMGFFTALRLSLNNLMTKKGRTFMVAFAGSIGIIGIALILSLSTGVRTYIKNVEEDTLAVYPLTIESESMDSTGLIASLMGLTQDTTPHADGKVYSSNVMGNLMNTLVSQVEDNDLGSFKNYLETSGDLDGLISGVSYEYGVTLNIFNQNAVGGALQVNPSKLLDSMTNSTAMSDMTQLASMSSMSSMSSMASMYNMNAFFEITEKGGQMRDDYEVLAGRLPQKYDELLLVVGANNDISDMSLYTLGLRDQSEVQTLFMNLLSGGTNQLSPVQYEYDELLALTFQLVLPGNLYRQNDMGVYADVREDSALLQEALDAAIPLRVVGIARSSADSLISTFAAGGIGYTSELVAHIVAENAQTPAVQAQLASPETDIFTGIRFGGGAAMEPSLEMLDQYLATLPEGQQASIKAIMGMMNEEQLLKMMKAEMAKQTTAATYEGNLSLMNATDLDTPVKILIYPVDFDSKEKVTALIEQYNARMQASGREGSVIRYTDYVGTLMSSVSGIVDTISYVLIAFVSISLVVSSIMIGIITYISVLERTKEIGILRAMGASKGDISRVFTAETLIIGFVSGLLGILVTWLLTFPANFIVGSLTTIKTCAILPGDGAVLLVLISMLLTLVAGFIPSRIAARKDPVVALRTE